MSPEGYAAIASIVVTVLVGLRLVFGLESKVKNIIDPATEGSIPKLVVRIQMLEAEKLVEAKAKLADAERERLLPITSTPVGQRVHDMSNQMTLHYESDDRRFDEMTTELRGIRSDIKDLADRLPRRRGVK